MEEKKRTRRFGRKMRGFTVSFSKTYHKDVIEKLESVENRRDYLVSLIRADINKGSSGD